MPRRSISPKADIQRPQFRGYLPNPPVSCSAGLCGHWGITPIQVEPQRQRPGGQFGQPAAGFRNLTGGSSAYANLKGTAEGRHKSLHPDKDQALRRSRLAGAIKPRAKNPPECNLVSVRTSEFDLSRRSGTTASEQANVAAEASLPLLHQFHFAQQRSNGSPCSSRNSGSTFKTSSEPSLCR